MCTIVETNSFYVLMILIFTAMVVINGSTHYPEFKIVSCRLKINYHSSTAKFKIWKNSFSSLLVGNTVNATFPVLKDVLTLNTPNFRF